MPIASAPREVLIHVDRAPGQLFNIGCSVSSGGRVLAMGKQGDTLRVPCTKPMEVEVKVNGWFGKPRLVVQPGERYNAKPRRVGFYLEKVDQIAGIQKPFGSSRRSGYSNRLTRCWQRRASSRCAGSFVTGYRPTRKTYG